MPLLYFMTHPQVLVDPSVPVPHWRLTDLGRRRVEAFAAYPMLHRVGSIWASEETKAREAADILAAHIGLKVNLLSSLGENDRSSTGFLPSDRFEAAADAFFAAPEQSWRGWERAIDAQRRIIESFNTVLNAPREPGRSVIVVSHGAVGTLLKCHLRGRPISRDEDQPTQGHYYTVDLVTRLVRHDWRALPKLGNSAG